MIQNYKIVDIFPYFNEEELLELRIRVLRDHVDKFIICDANRTHTGQIKEYTCKNKLNELNLLSDKINVIEVDLSNLENKENTWNREKAQRNAAKDLIEENDICIVSDLDEIINPIFINYYALIAKANPNNILRIPLVSLNTRADLRVFKENGEAEKWDNPFFCLKHHLEKYTLSDIRESKSFQIYNIEFSDILIKESDLTKDAGWHFTWMGGGNRRLIKYRSFMHYFDKKYPDEVVLPKLLDDLKIPNDPELRKRLVYDWVNTISPLSQEDTEKHMVSYVPKEGEDIDILGRKIILKKYSKEFLPKEIFENKKIKEFLLPEETNVSV